MLSRSSLLSVLMVVGVTLLPSCACPRGSTTRFSGKFEQDTPGQPPRLTRQFGAVGATLEIEGDVVTVESPQFGGGRGVRLSRRLDGVDTRLLATADVPLTDVTARVTWKGFAEHIPFNQYGALRVQVQASNHEPVVTLMLIDEHWSVEDSVGGRLSLTGPTYDPRVDHTLRIVANPVNRTVKICINGSVVLSNRPWESAAARDVQRVDAVVPQGVLEATPSTFVCDLVRIAH